MPMTKAVPKNEWTNEAYPEGYNARFKSKGIPPNLAKCCESVSDRAKRWPSYHQCSRERGFGPGGAYCKQHDPDAIHARLEKNNAEQRRKWDLKAAQSRLERAAPDFLAALREIADGHNDPRVRAAEAIRAAGIEVREIAAQTETGRGR